MVVIVARFVMTKFIFATSAVSFKAAVFPTNFIDCVKPRLCNPSPLPQITQTLCPHTLAGKTLQIHHGVSAFACKAHKGAVEQTKLKNVPAFRPPPLPRQNPKWNTPPDEIKEPSNLSFRIAFLLFRGWAPTLSSFRMCVPPPHLNTLTKMLPPIWIFQKTKMHIQ